MAEIDSTVCDLLRRTPVDSGDSGTNWVARECEQAQEREGKVGVCSNGSGRCSFYSEREGQRGTDRCKVGMEKQRATVLGVDGIVFLASCWSPGRAWSVGAVPKLVWRSATSARSWRRSRRVRVAAGQGRVSGRLLESKIGRAHV